MIFVPITILYILTNGLTMLLSAMFVKFRDLDFDLGDLREFLIDNNISLSIDVYNVNRNGIFDIDNNQIVKITGLDIFNKDDLIKI